MDHTNKTDIFPMDISKEMKDSYLQYAMSVIIGRALPDVRDGLKPVHRRILYAMMDLNNTFDKPYKKSARIVGDVIGKYHPHGEAAVYDTIVRMAQDFSMNHTLVDGQGNFGSVDGDTAAASRYTEIRMTELATELLKDIEKETCNFEWNYDDSLLIPTILPARIPHLLVNGSAGIAVGMASNIPPHNLNEVVSVCIELLSTDLSLDEIIQKIPGPDFPTAGIILGRKGSVQAYKTGRGSIVMRAVAEIEEHKGGERIIVTELPYQVNKANLIESVASLVKDKKIEGISDIRDESSREGMRIVILVKKRENTQVILNNLYKQTRLQTSFGMNLLALDREGQPRTFSIKEILLAFLEHRRDVVTRRLVFELNKAREKLHILEGLTKALDQLDAVITLIRESKEVSQAKQGLIHQFQLTPVQAQAILDLRLHKLTGLEREKIAKECQELREYVDQTQKILADPEAINDIIREELEEVKKRFSRPRRTQIEEVQDDFTDKELIAKEDIVVLVTSNSGVKRILLEEYRLQKRGGVGLKGVSLRPNEDWVWKTLCVTTHTTFLVLTNEGRLFHLDAFRIPSGTRTSKSSSIKNLLPFGSNEHIRDIVPVDDFSQTDTRICMMSEQGVFKKTSLSLFVRPWKKGVTALQIKEGDQLVAAVLSYPKDNILAISEFGQGVQFKEEEVRLVKGRSAFGVRGMKLRKGDKVIGVYSLNEKSNLSLFTVTKNGYGKLTDVSEIRVTKRGGLGVKIHKITERTGNLAEALIVEPDQQVLLVTNKGQTIRFSCREVNLKGRNTQGVRLIRLKEGENVTGVSCIEEMDRTVEHHLDSIGDLTKEHSLLNGKSSDENEDKN